MASAGSRRHSGSGGGASAADGDDVPVSFEGCSRQDAYGYFVAELGELWHALDDVWTLRGRLHRRRDQREIRSAAIARVVI